MRALAADHHQPVAAHRAHPLAVLHRNAPLPFLHDHDDRDGQDRDQDEDEQLQDAALDRRVDDVRGHGRDDAAEDDDRDTVADALLGDDLAQPHGDHRAGGQRDQDRRRSRADKLPKPNFDRTGPAWLRALGQQRRLAESLQQRQRDGQPVGVLVELIAARIAFLLQLLPLRNDRDEQLDDDRRGDVRVDTHGHHREVLQRAARQQVEQAQQLVRAEDRLQRLGVHARHRDVCEQAVDHQDAQGDQQLASQVRQTERITNRF